MEKERRRTRLEEVERAIEVLTENLKDTFSNEKLKKFKELVIERKVLREFQMLVELAPRGLDRTELLDHIGYCNSCLRLLCLPELDETEINLNGMKKVDDYKIQLSKVLVDRFKKNKKDLLERKYF